MTSKKQTKSLEGHLTRFSNNGEKNQKKRFTNMTPLQFLQFTSVKKFKEKKFRVFVLKSKFRPSFFKMIAQEFNFVNFSCFKSC